MSRVITIVLLVLLAGCGKAGSDPGGSGGSGGSAGSGGSGGSSITLPELSSLTPGKYNEVVTGGDTMCAHGDPYSFFVWPGASDKVVVNFMGGGACWEATGIGTCAVGSPVYSGTVDENVKQPLAQGVNGFFDMTDVRNPAHDYTHVIVSYCTGDVHWGNGDHTYGSGASTYVIHHRGAINARAALGWVYDNFPTPAHVFVTGCSAGAYGAVLFSADVKHHYGAGVDVQHFSDSGAGIITDDFRSQNFPHWNVAGAFPAFIPALDPSKVDVTTLQLTDMYAAIGQAFPDMRLAQSNSVNDQVQTLFYLAMGGDATLWSPKMLAAMQTIHGAVPGFRTYLTGGDQHCVLPDPDFYTQDVQGTKPVDFVQKLMNAQDPGNAACATCQ